MRKKVNRSQADIELHQAASEGNLGAVRAAIAKGADVNSQEEEHYITPLQWACSSGHFDIVVYLVDTGAEINYVDDNITCPLHEAIYSGHTKIIRFLLDRGADINVLDSCGHTPLEAIVSYETASDKSRKEVIDTILETGYDVNTRNPELRNQTALMAAVETAAETGKTTIVSYLLNKGANIEIKDDEGYSAIDYALGDYEQAAKQALQI